MGSKSSWIIILNDYTRQSSVEGNGEHYSYYVPRKRKCHMVLRGLYEKTNRERAKKMEDYSRSDIEEDKCAILYMVKIENSWRNMDSVSGARAQLAAAMKEGEINVKCCNCSCREHSQP